MKICRKCGELRQDDEFHQFVAMFCREMKVQPDVIVNRIEFFYVD